MDEAARIGAFWEWWARHESGLSALLDAGAGEAAQRTLDAQLGEQVNELDPRLSYRIDPGAGRSRRTLTITAHGQGPVLGLARRVRLAGPAPSRRWSYSNFVLPTTALEHATLGVDNRVLRLADTQVAVRDAARKVDLTLWHPQFERFAVPEQRHALASAILETALGEETLLCWVNDLSVGRSRDWRHLAAVKEGIDDVRARFMVNLPGNSRWSHLDGTRYDGAQVHARVTVPLCAARSPLLEKVVTIRLHLEEPAGSPHADALEERIERAMAFDGELVAVETVGDMRTWYCYLRPDTGATQRLLDLAKAEELGVEAANDPTWELVSHLS